LFYELDARAIRWLTVNPLRASMAENFVSADNFESARKLGGLMGEAGCVSAIAVGRRFAAGSSDAEKGFGFVSGFIDHAQYSAKADYFCFGEPEEESAP